MNSMKSPAGERDDAEDLKDYVYDIAGKLGELSHSLEALCNNKDNWGLASYYLVVALDFLKTVRPDLDEVVKRLEAMQNGYDRLDQLDCLPAAGVFALGKENR